MTVGGPGRRHHVHDLLERNVRVGEGVEIDGADSTQNVDERRPGIDRRAQSDRAHEHSHEVVESSVSSPGDRRSDHDVRASTQPGQQHGIGSVQHHERRRRIGSGNRLDRDPGVRRKRDRGVAAAQRLGERTRSIARKVDQFRCAPQRLPPIRRLCPEHARGFVHRAQRFPLPDGEVRVVHFERG